MRVQDDASVPQPNRPPIGYRKTVPSPVDLHPQPTVLEFFAGIGLARIGLEAAGLRVTWSNDYEPDKHAMYVSHFGDTSEHKYVVGDIGSLDVSTIPTNTSVAWASSPCTDLSLAGGRAGLAGRESSAFWAWVKVLKTMGNAAPDVVVLENVIGLATSHGGDDLREAIRALNGIGYSIDLLAIDARRFLPQSRPRMFLIGLTNPPAKQDLSSELRPDWAQSFYADPSLRMHRAVLPAPPPFLLDGLTAIVDDIPLSDDRWWDRERVESFVTSLSNIQLERVRTLRKEPGVRYRTAYRRTRNGKPTWEVRADDVSGCLRTARGGSSKQAVVRMGNGRLHVRWMTPSEYAKLMGAESYVLTGARTSQALFAFGDAVAVPAVEWLGREYLKPHIEGRLDVHGTESRIAHI